MMNKEERKRITNKTNKDIKRVNSQKIKKIRVV